MFVAWVTGAAEGSHAAVGAEDVVDEAGGISARVEDDGAGAVAEEDGCRAVLLVHYGAHGVGPDQEHASSCAARQHGVGDGGRVEKPVQAAARSIAPTPG